MKCILSVDFNWGRIVVRYLEKDPQPKVKYIPSSLYCFRQFKRLYIETQEQWVEEIITNYLLFH